MTEVSQQRCSGDLGGHLGEDAVLTPVEFVAVESVPDPQVDDRDSVSADPFAPEEGDVDACCSPRSGNEQGDLMGASPLASRQPSETGEEGGQVADEVVQEDYVLATAESPRDKPKQSTALLLLQESYAIGEFMVSFILILSQMKQYKSIQSIPHGCNGKNIDTVLPILEGCSQLQGQGSADRSAEDKSQQESQVRAILSDRSIPPP